MTPNLLRLRYPAFKSVDDETIAYWLIDAERIVDNPDEWGRDYEPALFALAAHGMASNGALTGDDDIPTGVTSLRSGNLSITRTAESASEGYAGDYTGTKYGRQFLVLLRQNKGGMRVTGTGLAPYEGFGYLSGLHPSW
jgi:hypothetical protein